MLDCGVESEGGLGAGLALAQIGTAGLAEISLIQGEIAGHGWPHVLVASGLVRTFQATTVFAGQTVVGRDSRASSLTISSAES